ncbi:SGNH/GDSL hydrolase family protein [Acidovorax sp.]|uniref:SGNH/GDSL hydrolase family protein n=1 Tax=Acidovorax sp. TaxID=1872122 RepID=UPI0031DBBE1D
MKRIRTFLQNPPLAGFFMAACLALAACGGGGSGGASPEPVTVDLYGDSIPAGYGVAVTPLERIRAMRPQWQVVDHAANGTRLKDLMPGFATAPRTGRYVVLQPGFVDAFRATEGYELDLRTAIDQVQREGRVPVLTGIVGTPSPPPLAAQYNAITHALAREYGLQHAGWGEDYRDGDTTADGIHRTQDASDRLAALLVAAIDRAAEQKQR